MKVSPSTTRKLWCFCWSIETVCLSEAQYRIPIGMWRSFRPLMAQKLVGPDLPCPSQAVRQLSTVRTRFTSVAFPRARHRASLGSTPANLAVLVKSALGAGSSELAVHASNHRWARAQHPDVMGEVGAPGRALPRLVHAQVHCVRAFGPLAAAVRGAAPFPAGLVLHSWAGSAEVTAQLARLPGVHFSVSGHATRLKPAKVAAMLAQVPSRTRFCTRWLQSSCGGAAVVDLRFPRDHVVRVLSDCLRTWAVVFESSLDIIGLLNSCAPPLLHAATGRMKGKGACSRHLLSGIRWLVAPYHRNSYCTLMGMKVIRKSPGGRLHPHVISPLLHRALRCSLDGATADYGLRAVTFSSQVRRRCHSSGCCWRRTRQTACPDSVMLTWQPGLRAPPCPAPATSPAAS